MEVPRALPVGLHFSLTTIILLTRKRDVNPSASARDIGWSFRDRKSVLNFRYLVETGH
jgi:hypothetical protein